LPLARAVAWESAVVASRGESPSVTEMAQPWALVGAKRLAPAKGPPSGSEKAPLLALVARGAG